MDSLAKLRMAQVEAEPLQAILESDDLNALEEWIEAGRWDPQGFLLATSSYPLDWAAPVGAVRCLERLLSLRDQQPGAADQALVDAVRENQVPCVRLLLESGIAPEGLPDLYKPEIDGDSPISVALHVLNPEVVSMLCEAGGIERSEVGWLSVGLRTALASRKRTKRQCLFLVAEEIVRRIQNEPAFTLSPEVMKKLADWLKKEANKDKGYLRLESVIRNRFDAEEGLKEEVTDFLALSGHGRTRQDCAWLRGVFLEQEPSSRTRLASAALPYLVKVSNQHDWWDLVFEALEKWGADIDATSEAGKTPLMWVFTTRREVCIETVRRLLGFRPDVNVVDNDGNTALFEACLRHPDRIDLHELLRSHGARTHEELGLTYPAYLEEHVGPQFARLSPLPE